MSRRVLGIAVVSWAAGGLFAGCEEAELVSCAPGTYVRSDGGAEYCAYRADEVPRDVLRRPRCPPELPRLTEFPGGFVCARAEVTADELPVPLRRVLADATGERPEDAPCALGLDVVVARSEERSVPELIARAEGGFAVAWAGAAHLLGDDGIVVSTHDVEPDGGLGYGLAELDGRTWAAWTSAAGAIRIGPLDGPFVEIAASAVSGPELAVDADGMPWIGAIVAETPDALRVLVRRFDPADLALGDEPWPAWSSARAVRPALARASVGAVTGHRWPGADRVDAFAVAPSGGVQANGARVFTFEGALESVDADFEGENAAYAMSANEVHVSRTGPYAGGYGDFAVLSDLGGPAQRVSIAQTGALASAVLGGFAAVVSYSRPGRAHVAAIQGPDRVGSSVALVREGLRDAAVAADGERIAMVWVQRAPVGEVLVFAPVRCAPPQ